MKKIVTSFAKFLLEGAKSETPGKKKDKNKLSKEEKDKMSRDCHKQGGCH